jgi:hypothetical protein
LLIGWGELWGQFSPLKLNLRGIGPLPSPPFFANVNKGLCCNKTTTFAKGQAVIIPKK